MLTIYSDDHHLHQGRYEFMGGQLMSCSEMPYSADYVLDREKGNRKRGMDLFPEK